MYTYTLCWNVIGNWLTICNDINSIELESVVFEQAEQQNHDELQATSTAMWLKTTWMQHEDQLIMIVENGGKRFEKNSQVNGVNINDSQAQ